MCFKKNQEDAALKINLEAAKEIARQLRLRNLSGIIVIDFINLDDPDKMQILLKEFRKLLSRDPIQATLVDVTELQLVEVTRKKSENHCMNVGKQKMSKKELKQMRCGCWNDKRSHMNIRRMNVKSL